MVPDDKHIPKAPLHALPVLEVWQAAETTKTRPQVGVCEDVLQQEVQVGGVERAE